MRIHYAGNNTFGQFDAAADVNARGFAVKDFPQVADVVMNNTFLLARNDGEVRFFGAVCGTLGEDLFGGKPIRQWSINEGKAVALVEGGDVYEILLYDQPLVSKLDLKFLPEGNNAKAVGCCCDCNVVLSQNGDIYMGDQLAGNVNGIKRLHCGREHILILDECGELYTLGKGSRGQLGHGDLDDRPNPTLLEGLAGLKIVSVAAGGWHSAAVTDQGDLYTWGWNGDGQLGIRAEPNQKASSSSTSSEDKEPVAGVMASPHVVDFDNDSAKAMQVACGSRHTVALLDNKEVHGCGWNQYGQLQDSSSKSLPTMHLLQKLQCSGNIRLKCGSWSTALITDIV